MAKQILGRSARGVYLYLNNRQARRTLRRAPWPAGKVPVVLDELRRCRQ